jgi:hypothetical protein
VIDLKDLLLHFGLLGRPQAALVLFCQKAALVLFCQNAGPSFAPPRAIGDQGPKALISPRPVF